MAEQQQDDSTRQPARRPYSTPRLIEYGTVESLTSGSRTRQADAAGGGFRRPA